MGRGRLRRGCSLEVIFEEDPDFCSHLDSLDGIAFRFGIKEPDDTISLDSLLELEEYQVRFEVPSDAKQVFRSLEGILDVRNMDSYMVEWDEFSMDSHNSLSTIGEVDDSDRGGNDRSTEKDSLDVIVESDDNCNANCEEGARAFSSTGNGMEMAGEKAPPNSGRRSRVSRRQIVQATWLGYKSSGSSSGNSSSSDESLVNTNDLLDDDNNNTNDAIVNKPPSRRKKNTEIVVAPTIATVTSSPTTQDSTVAEGKEAPATEPEAASSFSSITSTGSSTKLYVEGATGTRTSPTVNLVTSVEDFPGTEAPPIQLHLRTSPTSSGSNNGSPPLQLQLPTTAQPHPIFGLMTIRSTTDMMMMMEKDTLDSYISTMTDETDANAYTFADPYDDTHSVASTNYESSTSTSSTESSGESVCTVNSFSMQQKNAKSKSNSSISPSGSGSETDKTGTGAGANSNNNGNNSVDGPGCKYKTNLKVELVSQLNKSQQKQEKGNLGSSALPQPILAHSPHQQSSVNSQSLQPELPLPSDCERQLQPQPESLTSGEVKRVRALFELRNNSRPNSLNGSRSGSRSRSGSSSNGSTCPSSPEGNFLSKGGNCSPLTSPPGGSNIGRVSGAGIYTKNTGRRGSGSPNQNQKQQLSPTSSAATSPSKVLKTNDSNNNSPRGSPGGQSPSSYDYTDILINDKVVIEDSPDIYQSSRSRRNCKSSGNNNNNSFDRDSVPSPPITNKRPITLTNLNVNVSSPGNVPSSPVITSTSGCPPGSSLRRSQSMGTGISSLGSSSGPISYSSGILTTKSTSKTNIIAEELPAPDTVKNVRNVFENMLKMKGSRNHHNNENSMDPHTSITLSSFSGSFSVVKKSLSYIKSNPTSKIYRSESMRDGDFPSLGIANRHQQRYGKPVLLSGENSPAHSPGGYGGGGGPSSPTLSCDTVDGQSGAGSKRGGGGSSGVRSLAMRRSSSTSPTNKNNSSIERNRKISEPGKTNVSFSPGKINTNLGPSHHIPGMLQLRSQVQVPLTQEDPSFSESVCNIEEDYRMRKYVHPEVMQKIRSAGTTTTYFGGKIVAKTVKNRKIPVSRRHTFQDFQEYVGSNNSISDVGVAASLQSYGSSSITSTNHFDEDSNNSLRNLYSRRDSNSYKPALDIPLKAPSPSSTSPNSGTTKSPTSRPTISGALDSIFSGVGGLLTFASSRPIDTTPRIISVVHKSPPGSQSSSPVKSCSPVSSVMEEGRNSPEGCESEVATPTEKTVVEVGMEQDRNNNNLPGKLECSPNSKPVVNYSKSGSSESGSKDGDGDNNRFSKKFSQITEGAWF